MLLERIEDPGLSQYSYVVGCPAAGQAAVIDPRRDVEPYVALAARHGVRITHVLETHIHADFASGATALAAQTGAEIALSAHDEGERYEVSFPHRSLSDGETIGIGSVRLEALHTPGHTPEHISFLIYDESRSPSVPEFLLSGDFLFVGSLGRPDLLGEEVKIALARQLFASVRGKLPGLPDGLAVLPGHGAGSMCGAGMSAQPSSTLGFERAANPYLDPHLDQAAFVDRILAASPPFPPYYRRMKELNAEGAPVLEELPGGQAIGPVEFRQRIEAGHTVIDVRPRAAFGAGHIPGSLGLGLGPNLSTWAAWVVPYDTPLLLVAPGVGASDEAARALVRVGLDDVRGHLAGGFEAWEGAGLPVEALPQIPPPELHEWMQGERAPAILDVRSDAEWKAGHIDGATHIMGGQLEERLAEVPSGADGVAVICGSGYRSTVAASVLMRAGIDHVHNVPGGMAAWRKAGLPVTAG